MQQLSLTAPGTTALADTSNHVACLSSSSRIWVSDSSATDHMIGNTNILSFFTSSSNSSHVTLANGSTASVHGFGTTHRSPTLFLSSVLCLSHFPLI